MSDVVKLWIDLGSILIALVSAVVAVRLWVKNKKFIRRVQAPNKAVPDYTVLCSVDFENGMEILTRAAQKLRPNHIVGINRGGAIVAGYLGKKMKIPRKGTNAFFLLNIYKSDPGNAFAEPTVIEQRTDQIPINKGDIVLLVDDTSYAGNNMNLAEKYLMQKYPGIILKKYVLLNIDTDVVGPETHNIAVHLDECAFRSSGGRVYWFWDPDEVLMESQKAKEELQKQ